jgi:hypothetical protein
LWLGEDVLRRSVPLPNQMRLDENRTVLPAPRGMARPGDMTFLLRRVESNEQYF